MWGVEILVFVCYNIVGFDESSGLETDFFNKV
jgi:hypothetical protein